MQKGWFLTHSKKNKGKAYIPRIATTDRRQPITDNRTTTMRTTAIYPRLRRSYSEHWPLALIGPQKRQAVSVAAACTSLCLREPGEPMIVLHRRRGRDDENSVEGDARNLGLQGTVARPKAVERGVAGN